MAAIISGKRHFDLAVNYLGIEILKEANSDSTLKAKFATDRVDGALAGVGRDIIIYSGLKIKIVGQQNISTGAEQEH